MAKKMKMGKLPIAEIGGALAGAIAAGFVKKTLIKNAPDLSPTIKGAIITGAGAFLAMQSNSIMKGAGLAMVSVGGLELVNAFMPDLGINGVDDIFLSAPADQSILSAPADQSILSGGDDYAINGDDSMNGDFDSMNGDFDSMSGDELIGEEYGINGDE
jgi:hypothetical protein